MLLCYRWTYRTKQKKKAEVNDKIIVGEAKAFKQLLKCSDELSVGPYLKAANMKNNFK